ncbi:MAG: lytic transglycosylase domain-containing protein [Actinomycetota bacterium]
MLRPVRVFGAVLVLLAACSDPEPITSASPGPTVAPSPTPAATATAVTGDPFGLATRYDLDDPAELAQRLAQAEESIRAGRGDIAEHARMQQAAYRQLVRTPEWRAPAIDALPGELRPVARANVEAGAELRALTEPRTGLPPWKIVAPPPSDELRGHYAAAEGEFGIDWTYLAAIHLVETRMGRIRGTSTAGAEGPMQFLPSTWARWGRGDIENPRDAILAAGRYLRGHGAPNDIKSALFAYNHSNRYVRAITLYAQVMRDEPRAYLSYYNWDVYYRTTKGDALLYIGWPDR